MHIRVLASFAGISAGTDAPGDAELPVRVRRYVGERLHELHEIPDERRQALQEIAAFVEAKLASSQTARLTFICTHNSRRSHMAQIWAATAAAYYRVPDVEAYSGGTEATAFNPRAVAALQRVGFAIDEVSAGDNPEYRVGIGDALPALTAYSKVVTDPANPRKDFAAVMTCSHADEACPYVPGAAIRVSIPYDDPKAFDGTDVEARRYDERCRQIAREILYAFSLVNVSAAG